MKIDFNLVALSLAAIIKLLPDYVRKEVAEQIEPGPRGFKGDQGLKGEPGVRGEQGIQGDQGLVGFIGPQGKRGDPGSDGQHGPRGPQGLLGKTGQTGKQGQSGKKGLKGDRGIVGEVGPQGPMGPQGEQGLPPVHEWMGFKLRFQNPDGTWGHYVNLKGPAGERGDGAGALYDGFNYGDLFIVKNNYTTSGNERIVCTEPVTVFLNPNPFNDETVFIKRTNGQVTIDGNGHDIDDDSTAIMTREWMTLRLTYAGELQQWVIT
jgi:hypothetical protein